MELLKAKEIVVEAGKKLVSTGLIARTWGNVSCRVDDESFVITPSGRAYETLTPDDIVLVKTADLSYEGDIKPSSEKGIHAQCYLLRPECNFVIHTHQVNASIVSALGCDINNVPAESAAVIGDNIPVASYGLPGTGKLRKGVVNALLRSDSKAVIMKHHGTVCLGRDYDEAFKIASELETVCLRYLYDRYSTVTGKAAESFRDICNYVTELKKRADAPSPYVVPYDSTRTGNVVVMKDKDGNEKYTLALKQESLILGDKFPSEADMHMAVYKKRDDINCIIHSDKEEVVAASKVTKVLRPLLDDFAQIAGTTVRCVEFNPNDTLRTSKKVVKALGKHRTAALIKDNGAICCGVNPDEAEASEMVTAKNCKTFVASQMFDKVKNIGAIDSVLMNVVYRLKYSKQK